MATGGKNETSSNLLKVVGTLTLKPDDLDPWGVVVVGNKLVITDHKSFKVRVYRRHDGMLLSSTYELESLPFGLCRVSDTELCVAMKDGIAIMSVQDSGLISSCKTFYLRPAFDYCDGVALWNDNIVVSGEKDNTICMCVVSLQDERPEKIHKVCRGKYLSFLTVKQDMVYFSCSAYSATSSHLGVYGFNLLNPSQPTYTYKDEELWPRGITVNAIGHLFVCDFNSSIHHLTGKCELVAIYKNDLPRDSLAIFWDSGVLYLTSLESNVITIYKTPQQGTAIRAKAKTKVDRKDPTDQSVQSRQLFFGETRASKQDKVSQKGNISKVKQEAKISPLRPVINVDPVEQVTQRLSETGIHGSRLRQLSKDLICDDWRFFFRELSVTDEDMKRIECNYRHDGVREQIYQLLHFSNKKGILNKTNMMKALESIDRVDLVIKYIQETFPDS